MSTLDRPVIILGSVRSGTTLLGNVLKLHPDLCYWEEPKHIWRHRHAYRRHDVLTAADASPAIQRYITNQFVAYLTASGKSRFVEKTPSNCLRVPFIQAIFPDALFIHLIRDGRASAISARVQWMNDFIVANDQESENRRTNTSLREDAATGGVSGLRDAVFTVHKFLVEKRRLSGGLWTFLEAPAYIPDLLRVFARKLTRGRSFVWGTRFPGIQEVHRTYSVLEACALQWAFSVQSVQMAARNLPASQYLELRYEQLADEPALTLRQIMHFIQVPVSQAVLDMAEQRIRPDEERWRQHVTPAEMCQLEAWIGPLLHELNYR